MLQESYLSAQRDLSESPQGVKSEDVVMKTDDTWIEEATIYSLVKPNKVSISFPL